MRFDPLFALADATGCFLRGLMDIVWGCCLVVASPFLFLCATFYDFDAAAIRRRLREEAERERIGNFFTDDEYLKSLEPPAGHDARWGYLGIKDPFEEDDDAIDHV
jgi:hypothetical protein